MNNKLALVKNEKKLPIIDKSTNTVPTIENALRLIYENSEISNYNSWKVRGLGLTQALLGYAEANIFRLSRLSVLMYTLEEKLLDPALLNRLDDKSLMVLYRLVGDSVEQLGEYVKSLTKDINWTQFESDMLIASATQTSEITSLSSKELEDVSREVLSVLAKSISMKKVVNEE